LPEVFLRTKNPDFWYTLEGLGVENFGIACGHLVFIGIGMFNGNLV
jgi:hypothetical protein